MSAYWELWDIIQREEEEEEEAQQDSREAARASDAGAQI